ncbi:hypothetical protein JHK85_051246 [Glycine max]|nr:hypothetical protein JHK85_051246 [Glycine max]
MLVFGSETSCSSSDGSCSQVSLGREIKQQDIGFQNFMFRDHQNMNKFMMNINHDGGQEYVNQWTRNRNGYIFHTEQTTLDYDLQVIRNLICRNSRGNSNNAYLTVDENKTEEKDCRCGARALKIPHTELAPFGHGKRILSSRIVEVNYMNKHLVDRVVRVEEPLDRRQLLCNKPLDLRSHYLIFIALPNGMDYLALEGQIPKCQRPPSSHPLECQKQVIPLICSVSGNIPSSQLPQRFSCVV